MTDPSVLNAISNLQAQQAATDNRLAAHINTLQMQITNLSAMLASATDRIEYLEGALGKTHIPAQFALDLRAK